MRHAPLVLIVVAAWAAFAVRPAKPAVGGRRQARERDGRQP
ncbi:MAG TPA: hypothetical protein VK324_16810 [Tepidisphaeraceae bacterium]|nr:hypothetical protein [Tepidisphaeraceae bacterium]